MNAPLSSGRIGENGAPHVEFTVETAKMTVQPDPKVDANTQAKIQSDMDRMVLQPEQYPQIAFRSTHVEKTGDQWKVTGALSLHGVTKPVTVNVKRNGDAYTGRTTIKQTDFGIKPISLGGGTIKVKDQLEIEFQIFTH